MRIALLLALRWVMIAAVVIAVAIMLVFAGAISDFIECRPTISRWPSR